MVIADFLFKSSSACLPPEIAEMKMEQSASDGLRKAREFYKKIVDSGFLVRRSALRTIKSYGSVQELLVNLLENGYIDVEKTNPYGETLLYYFCNHYQDDDLAEITEVVCKYGGDVNYCHPAHGFNALMALINRRSRFTVSYEMLMDVASILVDYGLDVNHTDGVGKDITQMILESEDFSVRSTMDFVKLLGGASLK